MRLVRPMILIAVLDILLLIGIGVTLLKGGGRWVPPAPLAPAASSPVNLAGLQERDARMQQTPDLLTAPLFWPSRTPLPVTQSVAAINIDGAKLLGTFTGEGVRGAIIETDAKTKAVKRLQVGEALSGWTLMQVHADRVVFADANGRQATLQLIHAKQLEALRPASVAPAPPQKNKH